MTRGCPRNCAFCAVKTLEPQYKNYIGIKHQIKYVDEHFGAQKDLLLMDNNVFASNCFEQIIDEIKDCGFGKGATYIPPNEYDVGITWDSVPIQGITVQDLRNDSFDIFRERAILSKRMDRKDVDATNEQLLDSLNLLENGQLKRAAILLFHHNPEKWIPGAYVKIGYFESDSELRYQDEIHGSLISQADRVVDLIFTKYLKADISYKGVTRVETYPFPKDAIREAVFNAIAHKFYGALIPIQISVYADRLYIANDCIFPGDWTLDDLMGKHRSRPYNPLIANTFFRAGFIEAWGRGIEKIKDSCKEAGNPIPEYTIKREDIMIMFKSLVSYTNQATNQATDQTNQDEDNSVPARILKVIETKPMLSQRKIADIIGEKYSTVKYYMESMKKSGIIKREGSSQKGKWIIL